MVVTSPNPANLSRLLSRRDLVLRIAVCGDPSDVLTLPSRSGHPFLLRAFEERYGARYGAIL